MKVVSGTRPDWGWAGRLGEQFPSGLRMSNEAMVIGDSSVGVGSRGFAVGVWVILLTCCRYVDTWVWVRPVPLLLWRQ